MVRRGRGRRNPYILLVRMYISIVTMETRMEFPQKLKIVLACDSAIPFWVYIPEGIKVSI
jgi:hypothetical protein